MRLILVRHGQTDFNLKGIVQGQEYDPPLNEVGIAQVQDAISQLSEHVDVIVSSPLKRAYQTAELFSRRLQKPIEARDELKEFSYGSLAGKTWEEIAQVTNDPEVRAKDKAITFDYTPYDGESAEDVKKRVAACVEQLGGVYKDKTVLVAAHGGMVNTMHELFPQKDRGEEHNASMHIFEF